MGEILQRESVYLWFYADLQFRQIFWYWLLGMLLGSLVSVFAKAGLHRFCARLGRHLDGPGGWMAASLLGIASPLCMYGTIPLCASFSQKGIKEDFLGAFMMSSLLLNPQLLITSAALGRTALALRFIACLLCGFTAGALLHCCCKGRDFFHFQGFGESPGHDTHPNPLLRYLFSLGRNVKATGPWFALGILLSALFQRYVRAEWVGTLFGPQKHFGLLLAATAGVPLYVCGGGTIPMLQEWLAEGMGLGAAIAFMVTGPATKITNLGAMKIVLGARNFALYLAFALLFSLVAGAIVNFLPL